MSNEQPTAKKRVTKRRKQSEFEQLIEAALVWHAATVLSGQIDSESRADAYLRKRCLRVLKKHPDMGGVRLVAVKL